MTTLTKEIHNALDCDGDPHELLRHSSHLLDEAKSGDPILLACAQTLAHTAFEHGVFASQQTLADLKFAARCFGPFAVRGPRPKFMKTGITRVVSGGLSARHLLWRLPASVR